MSRNLYRQRVIYRYFTYLHHLFICYQKKSRVLDTL